VPLLLLVGWVLAEHIKPFITATYGMDAGVIFWLFVSAEALFNLSLLGVAWFSGLDVALVRKEGIRHLRLDIHNRRAVFCWVLNRISWVVPFLYVLYAGWYHIPWAIKAATAVEILVTLLIGHIVLHGGRRGGNE
jgi:hypothetical protein